MPLYNLREDESLASFTALCKKLNQPNMTVSLLTMKGIGKLYLDLLTKSSAPSVADYALLMSEKWEEAWGNTDPAMPARLASLRNSLPQILHYKSADDVPSRLLHWSRHPFRSVTEQGIPGATVKGMLSSMRGTLITWDCDYETFSTAVLLGIGASI